VKHTPVLHKCLYCALALILGTGFLAAIAGSQPQKGSIEGYWRGVQEDGAWAFVFQFIETSPGSYKGLIHVYKDDMKMEEVAIESVDYSDGRVRMHVEMNNIRVEGPVDFARQAIDATFFYEDGSALDMVLDWTDPLTLKGLAAKPSKPGEKYVYKYVEPEETGDGWKTSSLRAEGFDPEAIRDLVTAAENGEFGFLHSLLIARNGRLVLDEYFYGHDKDSIHRLASVTKSVSSLLIGIAVGRGEISGVEEHIPAFFPDYDGRMAQGWEDIRLGHILTMSANVKWDDKDLEDFYESEDHFGVIFKQPIAGPPGVKFEYVSPNVDLLAGVIKHATGLHADEYAKKYLFARLDFGAYDWDYGRWRGYPLMDGSLHLRPRDMAKLGQLVLDGGKWHGDEIVSADWINASTSAQIGAGGEDEYGYLWWRGSQPFGDKMVQGIFANGWGSQFIFILPEYNLVVVTTGGNEDNGKHMAPAKMFPKYILPALN
jgi:CubicO group peptidase (beta-lactamase class C family)